MSTPDLRCPNCQAPIAAEAAACPNCGADIQLMTLLADAGLRERLAAGRGAAAPVSTEQLIPRLGDYLVQQGYVTAEQLQAALSQQAEAADGEPRRLIGQTLVELGHLSPRDLDGAIARRLLELQADLLDANRGLERRVVERTAELEAALARLTEFNQLKANFVANVSHELRTPLTHIKGYNSLLRDEALGPVTPDQREALAVTAGAIARLERLVSDLISYAAAARGELTVNLRPVSVPMVVLQVMGRSAEKAERQRVRLLQDVPSDLPPVTADEEKLYWTLLQLVDNGLKFTSEGGQVSISAAADDQRVRVSVRDTGIGIPAARLPDIFEPFRQLDGSSTRRYGGTGLGLALVRRILDSHGSEIEVESVEGQGSTFSFALPRHAGPPGQPAP
jgi:signal transduction histidine kinase